MLILFFGFLKSSAHNSGDEFINSNYLYGENLLNVDWNEAQFDIESRLQGEKEPVSEIHFTPWNPRNFMVGIGYEF